MNTERQIDDITGAILAGGRSARMGSPKALLPLGERTFLQTIADQIGQVFRHVVVVGDDESFAAGTELPVIQDIHKNCGPLGGIHAALKYAETARVFVCSTDIPLVSSLDIFALASHASRESITVASQDGRLHPLFGVYPVSIIGELEETLRNGDLKLRHFLNTVSCGYEEFSLPEGSSALRNINTPEDFRNLGKR